MHPGESAAEVANGDISLIKASCSSIAGPPPRHGRPVLAVIGLHATDAAIPRSRPRRTLRCQLWRDCENWMPMECEMSWRDWFGPSRGVF